MIFKNLCVIVLWTKVASVLEGLTSSSWVPLKIILCYSHTFENNLGIKGKFAKYLNESCCVISGKHWAFHFFSKNAFESKIVLKLSALFWLL